MTAKQFQYRPTSAALRTSKQRIDNAVVVAWLIMKTKTDDEIAQTGFAIRFVELVRIDLHMQGYEVPRSRAQVVVVLRPKPKVLIDNISNPEARINIERRKSYRFPSGGVA